jgi:pimeloyl-ACP methyl ester carboxylesterase
VSEYFVEVNKLSLFVRRKEKFVGAPTIVFLHDSLGCVQLWRDFPEKLSNEVNCNFIVYDRQGYGKSTSLPSHQRKNDYLEIEAEILHDLIIKLELQNVILFGHSDGGSIALIAASKYPSMVSAVIVEAAHVFVEEVTLEGIRVAVKEYLTTDLKARLEKYHGDKTDTIFKAWTETWLGVEFREWSIEHLLTAIRCPLLFIQGDKDEYGTTKQMQVVADHVTGKVETHLILGSSHTPHKTAETEVISLVKQFIGSNSLDNFT